MATRRSTRLRHVASEEAAKVDQPATVEPPRKKANTRKTDTTVEKKTDQGRDRAKKPANPKANKNLPIPVQFGSTTGPLASLPPEVLQMVINNMTDLPTLNNFGRTCKRFYPLTVSKLYRRLAVSAMFHAHIPKMIRTLEPVLSIAQKKKLHKEGKYKGQQEKFPRGVDEKAIPGSASLVRQLILGVNDPGKKHEMICVKYLEEVLKNCQNLEVLETRTLTTSMAKSIASQKNLSALRLYANGFETEDIQRLAKLNTLRHLSLSDYNSSFGNHLTGNVFAPALLNSKSTLESLEFEMSLFSPNLFEAWERDGVARLAALKLFALSGFNVDNTTIKALNRAVDFLQLRELSICDLSDPDMLFYENLSELFGSAQSPSLRTLKVDMGTIGISQHQPHQNHTYLESKFRFISSFDSLTSLDIRDYNQYPSEITVNPGLEDFVLPAILKHKNLKTLKISYKGILSGLKIPYLSPTEVETIMRGLPELEEFEFAPDNLNYMDETGQALALGKNLKSVICPLYASWASGIREEKPGFDILSGILKPLLDIADTGSGKFVWENHYKLNRISTGFQNWQIATKFGKGIKGMSKSETIKSNDRKREVKHRDISGTNPLVINLGYDPTFEWAERVSKGT